METEQQLLDAIHSGDREARRRLYDRFSGYAMAIGLRYIPDREEVRDVLQDSFMKILISINDFDYRGEGSLRNWVSRIVANMAVSYLRKQQRVTFVNTIPDRADEEVSDFCDIPPDLLMEMIGRLPANYRLVLNLFAFEQWSHRDIARQLGIKEATSSTIYFRAKKMLSKMIQEYYNEQEI